MQRTKFIPSFASELFVSNYSFLGHRLSADGISVEVKIRAIKEWSVPKNVRDIQSFLGACSYY